MKNISTLIFKKLHETSRNLENLPERQSFIFRFHLQSIVS